VTRALVVGAGAVGQVLALHLVRAGAEVSFAVRRPDAVRPVTLWRLRSVGGRGRDVLPALPTSRNGPFDVVFLTVPSDALDGAFLREVAKGFGEATVVGLQPGLDDRRRLLSLGVTEPQLVRCLISLVAFHAPLSAKAALQAEGTPYWFPPLSPWTFDGPSARAEAVVALLRRGGMPAAHGDVGGAHARREHLDAHLAGPR
jgi:ketopantoate reductase